MINESEISLICNHDSNDKDVAPLLYEIVITHFVFYKPTFEHSQLTAIYRVYHIEKILSLH